MSYNDNDILDDELIKDFFLGRTLVQSTKDAYVKIFKNYCNWRNQLPNEFIEEADIEQAQNIKLKKRKIKKDLINYIQYLKDGDKSQNTINNYIASIKALYYDNDITLPTRLPTRVNKDKEVTKAVEELPKKEDVRQLIDTANARDTAITLLQLSSGLSAVDVRLLKYKDFLQAFELPIKRKIDISGVIDELTHRSEEDSIGWWNLKRFKTNIVFYTFNSPECTKAIVNYLDWRFRANKPIYKNSDRLFTTITNNESMGRNAIIFMNHRLNTKAGFGRREGSNRRFITSHLLREMFSSGLFRRKIDKLRVDFFLGHKINEQDAAYFRSNPEDLFKDYLKALPEITLERVKVKRFTSPEVKEIVTELEGNKKKLNKALEWIDDKGWIVEGLESVPEIRQAYIKAAKEGKIKIPKSN